jgi:hypothetical protein
MSLTKASFSMIAGAQVNAIDYGALGDGSGALVGSAATGAPWNVWPSWINGSNYGTKPGHDYGNAAYLAANPPFSATDTLDFVGIQLALWAVQTAGGGTVNLTGTDYVVNRPIRFVMPSTGIGVNLVGSHYHNCIIRPLTTLSPINSIGTNIGSGVLYFYKIGLSGCTVQNVGVTTFPKNGGTPSVEFSSATVTANWSSNGTYHACVLYNNCDTVNLNYVFMSGYGEAAVVATNSSSINLNNIVTEYQSCAVLLTGGSQAYIVNSILFNSSGTGLNSWGTSGVCLSSSTAYIVDGQITNMRNYAVYAIGTNNVFTCDEIVIITSGYGMLFFGLGLANWRIANCLLQYGSPNQTPIVLLDNQNTGSGDTLNSDSAGLFLGNNVANDGTVSTMDIMRINATYSQITNNNFNARSTGSSTGGYVINSLINGNYAGAGTVKCIYEANLQKFFAVSQVSVFGLKANNIDNAYVPYSYVTATTYTVGGTEQVIQVNGSATCTLTMPTPSAYVGRIITVTTQAAYTVVSASSNITPINGGANGTAILAATAGKWANLISDGTQWRIIASN